MILIIFTIDDTNADEVGNDVNAKEEEYSESYFVPDDEELIVIIEEVDDNIIKTTITASNNDDKTRPGRSMEGRITCQPTIERTTLSIN